MLIRELRALALVLLAACGPSKPDTGPAPSDTDTDTDADTDVDTDTDADTDTDTEPAIAPTVAFVMPTTGESFAASDTVLVEVQAADADTANLAELGFTWGGAAAGAGPANPDSSGNATFALPGIALGDQTLSVTVTDPDGLTGSATVLVEIVGDDADGDGFVDVA